MHCNQLARTAPQVGYLSFSLSNGYFEKLLTLLVRTACFRWQFRLVCLRWAFRLGPRLIVQFDIGLRIRLGVLLDVRFIIGRDVGFGRVRGVVYLPETLQSDVGVDLRGVEALVPQQRLQAPQISPVL